MGLSNQLFCEGGSFSHQCNPHRFLQSEVLRLFPHVGTLGCLAQWFSQFICMQMWERPVIQLWPCPPWYASCCLTCLDLQPPPCCVSSPSQLPVSAPPTSLNECFFFNSLVVRLPYISIFSQF